MKGFKHTGNGPKSGFTFPSKAGFGPSTGKVKNVSGYSRRAPKRRAVGGLVKDNIVEAPGFSDFAKGGRVAGVSNPMTAKQAMSRFAKGGKVKEAISKIKYGPWPPGKMKPLFPTKQEKFDGERMVPVKNSKKK